MAIDWKYGMLRSGKAVVWAGAMLLGIAGMSAGAQDTPPPPMQTNRPPMERAFRDRGGPGGGPMGKWWDNPKVAQDLNLGADQKQKMDDIFQQSRLKLIDLHASLQKEEAVLEPLISADSPNESQVLSQIDKIAQARAELEKANARMLLSIRQVLTGEQWTKLKAKRAERMTHGHGGPGEGLGSPPPPQ